MEAHEFAALIFASECAGEYIEEIGQTDLSQYSYEQWQTLVEIIGRNYLQKHNELLPCPF